MNMNSVIENPMYYRAHPYRNQGDLPDSAFKNRQIPNFHSQIPQGRDYFQPSNKKHYAGKYRSQIEQENVLTPQSLQQMQKSNIFMEKSYFRSLNVEDIEGAKPNTLISKAVKNKQKANSFKKQQNLSNSRKQEQQWRGQHLNYENMQKYQQNQPRPNYSVNMQQNAMEKYLKTKQNTENNSMINLPVNINSSQPNKNYHFISNNSMYNKKGDEIMNQDKPNKEQYNRLSRQNNEHANNLVNYQKNSQMNKDDYQAYEQAKNQAINQNLRMKTQNNVKSYKQEIEDQNNQLQREFQLRKEFDKNSKMNYHQQQQQQQQQQQKQNIYNLNQMKIKQTLINNQRPQTLTNNNSYGVQLNNQYAKNQQQYFQLNPNATNLTTIQSQKNPRNYPAANNFNLPNQSLDKSLIRKYFNPTFLSYQSGGINYASKYQNQRNQRSISLAAKNIVLNQNYYK